VADKPEATMVVPAGQNYLTRAELDQLKCANGCDDHPIRLYGRCHPDAPHRAFYDKETGQVVLLCAMCGKHVVAISVETRIVFH
jgi:hypothetical protein